MNEETNGRRLSIEEITYKAIIEAQERQRLSEIKKQEIYDTHIIATFNYARTLEEFKIDARVEQLNQTNAKYLEFLNISMKIYGNSAFYHTQYTDSRIGNEHSLISRYCKEELSKLFNGEEIEKAIALVGNIKFDKFYEMVKGQSLAQFPNLAFIDYSEALETKKRVMEAHIEELKGAIDEIPIIERMANYLINNREIINGIRNGGYFLNMELLGRIWAYSELVINHKEIIGKLSNVARTTTNVKSEALYVYYTEESGEERITTPKITFWEALNKKTGLSAKTIEMAYNTFNNPPKGITERTKPTNITNLKNVIDRLELAGHTIALENAKKELEMAMLNS
jgi:hypothetical protein